MSESIDTSAVVEAEVVAKPTPATEDTKSDTAGRAAAPVRCPADDLREIQNLLVNGMFPGNMAPAVHKAFLLLDNMAKGVEEKYKAANETQKPS